MLILKASQHELFAVLQSVCGIVERNHNLEILRHVVLRKNSNEIEFITNNVENELRTIAMFGDEDEVRVAITVGAHKLMDILRAMPSGQTITLHMEDSRLIVKSGKSRFAIQTLSAEDFPFIGSMPDDITSFSVPQKTLKKLLGEVSFAMAVQGVRHFLKGVLFATEGKQLRLVATDASRMAYATAILEDDIPKQEVILPRTTVLELQRLLSDDENAKIEMRFSDNLAHFSFGKLQLTTQLVEGKFPDYKSVLPESYPNQVIIARQLLLACLHRVASLMTYDKSSNKGVRINLESGVLRASWSGAKKEESLDELDIDYNGSEAELCFNVDFLIDVLSVLSQETVKIEWIDGNSSSLLTAPGNADFRYVVMPLHI